ncbi:hypothetical protein BB560_000880 [Smittium megazygosporum]|uniref:Uncharacterized protein n=1 Tax=Smittium megazygosporum TaxID=133381 RepID=A0A2T9ZJ26_9FUNG|nr:hypothetical protein BB560_000880 [Smittium megazygosporum]
MNKVNIDKVKKFILKVNSNENWHLYFENRLRTFTVGNWPYSKNRKYLAQPAMLASAGFYFFPQEEHLDNVRCAYCDKELDEWEEFDDPFVVHFEHAKNCIWAILHCRMRYSDDSGEKYRQWPTKTEKDKAEVLEYISQYEFRLVTFQLLWPHKSNSKSLISSANMANAGFYYCPDRVGDDGKQPKKEIGNDTQKSVLKKADSKNKKDLGIINELQAFVSDQISNPVAVSPRIGQNLDSKNALEIDEYGVSSPASIKQTSFVQDQKTPLKNAGLDIPNIIDEADSDNSIEITDTASPVKSETFLEGRVIINSPQSQERKVKVTYNSPNVNLLRQILSPKVGNFTEEGSLNFLQGEEKLKETDIISKSSIKKQVLQTSSRSIAEIAELNTFASALTPADTPTKLKILPDKQKRINTPPKPQLAPNTPKRTNSKITFMDNKEESMLENPLEEISISAKRKQKRKMIKSTDGDEETKEKSGNNDLELGVGSKRPLVLDKHSYTEAELDMTVEEYIKHKYKTRSKELEKKIRGMINSFKEKAKSLNKRMKKM